MGLIMGANDKENLVVYELLYTESQLTNGWSFLHCLRSSAKRGLQIPDMFFNEKSCTTEVESAELQHVPP